MSGPMHDEVQPRTDARTRRPRSRLARWAGWLLVLAPATALAVTTTAFQLEGVDAFEEGKFEGTAVLSDGRLVRATRTEPVELSGVPVAYTSAVDDRGRIFVGTGNDGEIHRIEADGKSATLHAKVDAAVVTALATAGDALFVGAMPNAGLLRVDASGQVTTFAQLEGAEHVWALAYDAGRKQLFAGTGPEGKVFRVDAQGKASVFFDAEAEHVMSLALGQDGALYAGTSDGALLYRLDGSRAEVVYDFPGDELNAISVRAGRIAVAVSEFPKPPAAPKNSKTPVKNHKPPKLKPGAGQVWIVHPNGRAERLFEDDESHVSDVELSEDGHVFVATGTAGRVLRVTPDGEHGVWNEVEGRQVLALGLTTKSPHFVVSDTAAVYRAVGPRDAGAWTSKPQDAETTARWGELTPRFAGDVRWQTRSGNTELPDATWTPWSRESKGAGPIRSPAGRYLQVRVLLGQDAKLRSLEALYLAANRPARARAIHIEPPKKVADDQTIDGVVHVPPTRKLVWETDNPDDDGLSYRLHFQRDGSRHWLPMQHDDELLTEAEFEWDTRPVPDGLYRVRVTTSDAPSNPAPYALHTETVSSLLRIDNHAPQLTLEGDARTLRGVAKDETSRIAALTLSIDGGPFWPIAPSDDLLDQRQESFEHSLPALTPGPHILAVRATDAAGHARVAQLEVERAK